MSYLFHEVIRYVARICWDYPALIDLEDKVHTYGELYKRSNRLANALLSLGLKKGDRVGIFSVDCKEYVEYLWACAKTGIIGMFSAIGPVYPDEWIEKLINKSDAKAFFVHENYLERFSKIRPKLRSVEKIIVIGSKGSVPRDMYHYETLINEHPDSEPKLAWELKEDECAFTLFSGGTTGMPKIIEHRYISMPWTYLTVIPRVIIENLLPKILNAPRKLFEEFCEILNSPFDELFLEAITDLSVRESLISMLRHMGELHRSPLVKVLPYAFRGKLRVVINPLFTSWGFVFQVLCNTLGGCIVLSKGLLNVSDYLYRLSRTPDRYLHWQHYRLNEEV